MAQYETYLEIRSPQGKTTRVLIKESSIKLGRAPDAGCRIDSKDVSRYHAEMTLNDLGQWSIRDLKSRNGTILNGRVLNGNEANEGWMLMEPGDRIELGDFTLHLLMSNPFMDEQMGYAVSYTNVEIDEQPGPSARIIEHADGGLQITKDQLQKLARLMNSLVTSKEAKRRLDLLLDVLVSPGFDAQVVCVLKIEKMTGKAQVHGEPRGPRGLASVPRFSRTVLSALLSTGESVLAGGSGAIEVSFTDHARPGASGKTAAMACPVLGNEHVMVAIYAQVLQEHALDERLAVFDLAAQLFAAGEASWRGR